MPFRSFYNLFSESIILTIILVGTLVLAEAQVRTSPSYQLQSDSVNFGGNLATSSSYSLESTAGEVATGDSDSSTYRLRAGYQQMQEVFLSMTNATSVLMTPNIGGITGGISNGSTSVSILTDSPSGYSLSISAESSPAMRKGSDTIGDYVPVASPNPDMNFSTIATDVHFGFSPEGNDITSRFQNNNSLCSIGTNKTPLVCWDGLSTTGKLIAQGSSNQPTGATTTINFRVGIGGGVVVTEGDYIATTTLTALPL